MDRSEPSLVPEWLKGAGGGGGATHHSQPAIHQDEGGGSFPSRQRPQAHGAAAGVNHGDYDSPRYAAATSRTYYSNTRRGGSNSSGTSERPLFERDSYARAYTGFVRSAGYRGGYDGIDRDRDGPRDRDWDWERERDREFRDRERDRALGFGGGDDRDRDRDRPEGSNFRRPNSGATGRYDSDAPLRRTQSMGTGRALENGEKKVTVDLGTLPTAPPATSGTLTSSMLKAAFERDFPSLGAKETQGAVQSSLGNVSILSPRPSWQSSSPRTEGTRSSASTAGLTSVVSGSGSVSSSVNLGGSGSGIGVEGWSSALAEVPSALTGPSSSINGIGAGSASVPNLAAGGSGLSTSGSPVLIGAKMAEALGQNPPRVRTPPQYPTESQRLDDVNSKPTRQLIPMKPSFPKNMLQGVREKTVTKVVRAVDVIAPQPTKLSQPLSSSLLVSSPYRSPPPPRSESLKAPQGKLSGRKTSKEAVAALSATSSLKVDGGSSASIVTTASAVVGLGGVGMGISPPILAPVPRKQKRLLDGRAVPIPPISVIVGSEGGSGSRSKDGGSASEDKRPPIPTQNRSDFFNALRKKAAGVGTGSGSGEKVVPVFNQKNEGANGKGTEHGEEGGQFSEEINENSLYQVKENGTVAKTAIKSPVDLDSFGIIDAKEHFSSNGGCMEGAEGNSELSTAPSSPAASMRGPTATEEEEAAFLRSLGWEESAEESGEGLTEEEINSFYQERLRSMSISPSLPITRNQRLRDVQVSLHVGSIGSISSGMSTSDSESDDDLHGRRRS